MPCLEVTLITGICDSHFSLKAPILVGNDEHWCWSLVGPFFYRTFNTKSPWFGFWLEMSPYPENAKMGCHCTISQIGLQVTCYRLSAGVLQVVYRLFADYLQTGIHISIFPVMICCFHSIFADGPTDRQTDPYIKIHERI